MDFFRGPFSVKVHILANLLAWLVVVSAKDDLYTEQLKIAEISDSKLFLQFEFNIQTLFEAPNHYHLFPRAIGQLVHSYNVSEFHISFTNGRWFSHWGTPLISGPPGVELWAWFKPSSEFGTHSVPNASNVVDELWKSFTLQLGGMLCSSLEETDARSTAAPQLSFDPHFWQARPSEIQKDYVRYSILPREAVCTENLTPWLKLLPCRNLAGLGAFLKPHKLYDVSFHSMQTHVRKTCRRQEGGKCQENALEMVQVIGIVVNTKNEKAFDLQKVFELTNFPSACPIADEAQVHIQDPATLELSNFSLSEFSGFWNAIPLSVKPKKSPSPIHVERFLGGSGTEYGLMFIEIQNRGPVTQTIKYFEMVPFFLRTYYHTLKVKLNNEEKDTSIFSTFLFKPAEFKQSSAKLEFEIRLEPMSNLTLTYFFEKVHLHWTDYLSDANRGWDVPSASIFFRAEGPRKEESPTEWYSSTFGEPQNMGRIVTDDLLVRISNPDFSMPYNVITLTGTAFALFFSTFYHLLIRKFKHQERLVNGTFGSNKFISKILRTFISFFQEELEVDPHYERYKKLKEEQQKDTQKNQEDNPTTLQRAKKIVKRLVIVAALFFTAQYFEWIPEIKLE